MASSPKGTPYTQRFILKKLLDTILEYTQILWSIAEMFIIGMPLIYDYPYMGVSLFRGIPM